MDQTVLILILYGSLLVLFGLGRLIGHILGLDKYFEDADVKSPGKNTTMTGKSRK